MRSPPAPCPYLPGRMASFKLLPAAMFTAGRQESMLADGWRRTGSILYQPDCNRCRSCIPLRLNLRQLWLDSRRRAACARNRDIRAVPRPAEFSREQYDLLLRYSAWRHGTPPGEPSADDYADAYLNHPHAPDGAEERAESPLVMEYRSFPGGNLVALGFLDQFPDGLSSVYFAFAPEEARRSAGALSVALECILAADMGKQYYYLGFWVPDARTMRYKADFRPFELAIPTGTEVAGTAARAWTGFESAAEALRDPRVRDLLPR